jgi:hypothetical protein
LLKTRDNSRRCGFDKLADRSQPVIRRDSAVPAEKLRRMLMLAPHRIPDTKGISPTHKITLRAVGESDFSARG